MIQVCALEKTFRGRKVLQMPKMQMKEGNIYSIIGANGSGKSTYARMLAGILKPDGNISKNSILTPNIRIGYLPQKPYAFRVTVKKNLMLDVSDEKKANELLDRFQLSHLASTRGNRLSGGETARMALARLLMKDYDLLICDEPTAAMDVEMSLRTEKILKDYCKERKCTIMLITHSLQQAVRISDEIWFLHQGILKEKGSIDEMLHSSESIEWKQYMDYYSIH